MKRTTFNSRAGLAICLLSLSSAFITGSAANKDTAVHALFDLASPETSPFPSDRFTLPDAGQNTGRRVNLPKPADCVANSSDCEEIESLNELDGFSAAPWLSIPFDGDIDPNTIAGNVFLIALADTLGSQAADTDDEVASDGVSSFHRIALNQIIWDQQTRTIQARSEEFLKEHTRYTLVVTDGIRGSDGQPVGASKSFVRYRHDLAGVNSEDMWYRRALLRAERAAVCTGVPKDNIVALSSFTTRSITDLYEKISQQVLASAPPQADFTFDQGNRAVFTFDQIQSITHNQQRTTGATLTPAVASLANARLVPGAVGRLASGHFVAPDYRVHPGEYIPTVASRTGSPVQQGTDTLHFSLSLPSGPMPARGWPVILFAIGSGGSRLSTFLELVSIQGAYGFALVAIDNVGHGFGPLSTWTVKLTDGSTVTFPTPGRAIDQNGDGIYNSVEGDNALGPQKLRRASDAVIQLSIDLLSVVRMIQAGVDVEGDGTIDLDASRIYFAGQSWGTATGMPLVGYTDAIRASFFIVPFSALSEIRRLGPGNRPSVGSQLDSRTPSLLNSAYGITSVSGVTVASPLFNENTPFRDEAPRVDSIPGASTIRGYLDRFRWRQQCAEPTAFISRLRRDPPRGVSVRPTLLWMARTDQTSPNPTTSELIRAGDLKDRTVYYRHDLFYAANPVGNLKNPHTIYRLQGPVMLPITVAIQEQLSQFFESDGALINQTSPYFEVPMQSPLPEDLDYIP
ncbi:MAG TPA: hypothetical protein VNU68_00610 [Verrucomicrobiae bacterium]|nr:hypothetical protein [Verrucomicrobiae bacterium]